MAYQQSGSSSTVSWSNWNLEMLVFAVGFKPENVEKKLWSKDKNQPHDINSGYRTRVTGPPLGANPLPLSNTYNVIVVKVTWKPEFNE